MKRININIVKGIIYKIINKTNNKTYIGQTLTHQYRRNKWYPTGALYRWACHITGTRRTSPLSQDLLLLGPDWFQMDVIEKCEVKDLNDREKFYIKEYTSMIPTGYNAIFGTSDINTTKAKVLFEKNELIPLQPINKLCLKKYSGQLTLKKGLDKITFLKTTEIEEIDIRPLKRHGIIDTIRVLVAIVGMTQRYRFQFGKKPLKTVAMKGVLNMIQELEIPPEKVKINPELQNWLDDKKNVIHFPHVFKLYENIEIIRITISPHFQNNSDYIRIIVHRVGDNKQKDMKRHILGTKSECSSLTYKRVIGLVSQLQKQNNNSIYVIDKCSQSYIDNQCQQQEALKRVTS